MRRSTVPAGVFSSQGSASHCSTVAAWRRSDRASRSIAATVCAAAIFTAARSLALPHSALARLNESLLQIQTGSDDAPAEHVLKFSDVVYGEWERLADGSDDLVGLMTGIDSVDLVTTGIRPGETWAIGGRTGDGKTSLALQIAAANCRRGVAVGYFSLLMLSNWLSVGVFL